MFSPVVWLKWADDTDLPLSALYMMYCETYSPWSNYSLSNPFAAVPRNPYGI